MKRVLGVACQRPTLGAEGHRAGRAGLPDLVPALRPERVDVPLDVDDVERSAPRRILLPGALRGFGCAHARSCRATVGALTRDPPGLRSALTRRPQPGSRRGPLR